MKQSILRAFFLLALPSAFLFAACNNDKIHSATDGGSMKDLKHPAYDDDTTASPNVKTDSLP